MTESTAGEQDRAEQRHAIRDDPPVPTLAVRLLGPLEVEGPNREPIAIASAPQRRLLSVLALHVGMEVRSASLEEWLGLSGGALRTSISRLRRVIGPDALETTTAGYRLDARVDAVDFERLTSFAPTVDDVAARSTLEEAALLWRGDPLVEFADEPWAEPEVGRLIEQYATAIEDLTILRLDAGEASTAVVGIGRLVESQPYRDRPRALLLRALDEDGRRTEALRAFQAYRTLLVDEIGTEPSSSVIELDRAIAATDDVSATLEPSRGHPAWTRTRRRVHSDGDTMPHRIPVPLSSFVGRQEDLHTIAEMLANHRLVTLTGSGGCGKTRLAIATATAEFAQRRTATWWCELEVVTNPTQVTEQVAAAVGLTPQPGVDPLPHLIGHLGRERPMLLVIDNAEHLLAPVTAMLAELMPRCPALRVLVTSREPLGLAGEALWRVPPLASPPTDAQIDVDEAADYDAIELFIERAREARAGFVVDHDALRDVRSICEGLDGLPLALELAAARTRTHPIDLVAKGINDAVRWHGAATRAPLARHATIHASIAWSVDLIDPVSRVVMIRLSVFQSSFTHGAAVAVATAHEPIDDVDAAISTLVDASLLQFDDATGRYRMLLTVRQFCAVRAQGSDELERARNRHARYFAHRCTEIGAGRHGIERGKFIREMPDLVAAMEWARHNEPRLVFEMCAGLGAVRSALGHHGNVADTWRWLVSQDRSATDDTGWSREWATAVAAQMAAATAHWIDVDDVVGEIDQILPAEDRRARSWMARGEAMLPAYHGHLDQIVAHVAEATARRDDLELSIYGGFAAYMLALMGRIDESARQVDALARLTQRHHCTFGVDTVGNGYAAAVVGDVVRGDLVSAAGRASARVPDDPAFSMTAAAALAHAALLTGEPRTLEHAMAWSRQRTIPVLRFLPTFIDLVGRLFCGTVEAAADLAEQYWEEAEPVPVSRVHPLPVLTSTLIAAGRTANASTMTDRAAVLVSDMDAAPLLDAGIRISRARLALEAGDRDALAADVLALLDITTDNCFVPMTIDALELLAGADSEPDLSPILLATSTVERRRIGSRPVAGTWQASNDAAAVSLEHAVTEARRSLTVATRTPPAADASL